MNNKESINWIVATFNQINVDNLTNHHRELMIKNSLFKRTLRDLISSKYKIGGNIYNDNLSQAMQTYQDLLDDDQYNIFILTDSDGIKYLSYNDKAGIKLIWNIKKLNKLTSQIIDWQDKGNNQAKDNEQTNTNELIFNMPIQSFNRLKEKLAFCLPMKTLDKNIKEELFKFASSNNNIIKNNTCKLLDNFFYLDDTRIFYQFKEFQKAIYKANLSDKDLKIDFSIEKLTIKLNDLLSIKDYLIKNNILNIIFEINEKDSNNIKSFIFGVNENPITASQCQSLDKLINKIGYSNFNFIKFKQIIQKAAANNESVTLDLIK